MTLHPARLPARVAAAMLVAACPMAAAAEMRPALNFYGVNGLMDMPSAGMQPDGELSVSVARFGRTTRTTLTFQILPRLQGSFRYTGVRGLTLAGYGPNDTYFDRSFDLRFRLLNEGRWLPAVTIGMQDFIGTGNFAGEYVVASKTFADRVRVTAGVGWGRLGSYGSFGTLGTRPVGGAATGGKPNWDQWFRGPMAAFGGIEWQATDKLALKAEYSSDAYALQTAQGLLNRRSPLNFGAEYQLNDTVRLGAYYLYGSEIGIAAHFLFNPRRKGAQGVSGPAPLPVAVRPARAADPGAWGESWADAGPRAAATSLRDKVAAALSAEGLQMESLTVSAGRAELRIRNPRYDAAAQAIGRAARVLAATMPASVETFDIVPVVRGMATASVALRRSDIEALEFAPDNAAALRARAVLAEAGQASTDAVRPAGLYPDFTWSLGPFARTGLFDPSDPFRLDVGARAQAWVDIAPGLVLSGSVTARVAGNLSNYNRPSNSVLPRVRTEDYLRSRRAVEVERLHLAWYARPGRNVYSRVTLGYLERSFAGISTELLWKPVNSRFALGAELNYVRQRAFNSTLGLGNYGVATGHVSAYYDFRNGFTAQLDVGRYLAGDTGATLTIDREFANGWKVGAFATLTNVSAAQFGEGSFDKGIRLTVPVSWLLGNSSRRSGTLVVRPIQRDGGARLNVDGRLYEEIRGYHAKRLDDQWGRVWR